MRENPLRLVFFTDFNEPTTLISKITETYSLISLVPPEVRSQGNKLLVPEILLSYPLTKYSYWDHPLLGLSYWSLFCGRCYNSSFRRFILYHKAKIKRNKLCSDYALALFSLSLPERFKLFDL